jgi:hypothetical protein
MSLIHPGVPHRLAVLLSKPHGIKTFIETGTFTGESAAWAAGCFRRVVTIEACPTHHRKACARFAGRPNVEVRYGDSARVLAELVPTLSAPALFWLDAHWSGEGTAGRDRECPLLEEIAIINASPHAHVLLIDDARLFLAPPPPPHRPEAWPDLKRVVAALTEGDRPCTVAVVEDIILRAPPGMTPIVRNYSHRCKVGPATLLR